MAARKSFLRSSISSHRPFMDNPRKRFLSTNRKAPTFKRGPFKFHTSLFYSFFQFHAGTCRNKLLRSGVGQRPQLKKCFSFNGQGWDKDRN
jgi:hypothetical protein